MAGSERDRPQLADFPLQAAEKLRFSDTDRLGHVNNTVFSTLLETGRVDFLLASDPPLGAPGCVFVIANLQLDFLAEITWPGTVEIGTAVVSVGTSSMVLTQALFQHGRCVASARSVLVQMNEKTRRALALSTETAARLEKLKRPQA